MSTQDNRQMIESLYDSFNAGDIAKVLAELSDNAKWVIPSISTIPFTDPKQGRNAVAEFFSTMSEHQEPQIFEVHGMVAEGDQVVAHGHYRCRLRPLTVAGKANSRTTLRCGKARSRSSKSTPILLPPWRPTRGQLRSEQNIDDRGYCACRRCDQSCPG